MTALIILSLLAADPEPEIGKFDVPMAAAAQQGDVVPYNGVLLTEENAMAQARRIVGCEAELDAVKKGDVAPLPIVVTAVIAVLVGAGLGFGIGLAVHK